MEETRKGESVLPDAIGLCPVHGMEFYYPLKLPLSSPFVRCPVAGCDKHMHIYAPAGRL